MNVKKILKQRIYNTKEMDLSVPLVTFYKENETQNPYSHNPILHYHLFNKKDSFIEILIDKNNQKIFSLNIICLNDINKNIKIDKKIEQIPSIIGNPIINTDVFKDEYFLEERTDFDIIIKEKTIYVLLKNINVFKKVKMNDVEILLDKKNEIAGYRFVNFSDEEWQIIKKIVESL